MKITTKIRWNMDTWDVLEEESHEYEGPVAQCYGELGDLSDESVGHGAGTTSEGRGGGYQALPSDIDFNMAARNLPDGAADTQTAEAIKSKLYEKFRDKSTANKIITVIASVHPAVFAKGAWGQIQAGKKAAQDLVDQGLATNLDEANAMVQAVATAGREAIDSNVDHGAIGSQEQIEYLSNTLSPDTGGTPGTTGNADWLRPLPGYESGAPTTDNQGGLLGLNAQGQEAYRVPQSWLDYTGDQTPENAESALLDFFMSIFDNPEMQPLQVMNRLMGAIDTATGEYEGYRKGIGETMKLTGPTLSLGGKAIKNAAGENVQIRPLNTMKTGILGYEAQADMTTKKLLAEGGRADSIMKPLHDTWKRLNVGSTQMADINQRNEPASFWERWLPVGVEAAGTFL